MFTAIIPKSQATINGQRNHRERAPIGNVNDPTTKTGWLAYVKCAFVRPDELKITT